MKVITVVAAIIIKDDQILCMQRGDGKYDYISRKYEFPGGKVEGGEKNNEALMRELQEEMNLDIEITKDQLYMTVDYTYPDFKVILHSYLYKNEIGYFSLNEHKAYRWMDKKDLLCLDWAPADLTIVERLMKEIF